MRTALAVWFFVCFTSLVNASPPEKFDLTTEDIAHDAGQLELNFYSEKFNFSPAYKNKSLKSPESFASTEAAPEGDYYTLAPQVQSSELEASYPISGNQSATSLQFDQTLKSGGTNQYGSIGGAMRIIESITDLGAGMQEIRVRVTAVDEQGAEEPWVDEAFAGDGLDSWRLDIATSNGGSNPIEPPPGFEILESGISVYSSTKQHLGDFSMDDTSDSNGLSGSAAISIGGDDIAGADMATIEMYWVISVEEEPEPDPDELRGDHAYVEGIYWNPNELPGWGFFVGIQEYTMFGAIYGYDNDSSTFIVLEGKRNSLESLIYRGDVFFVSSEGATPTDVGNFTWTVDLYQASPAAMLTITSNILNVSNLQLIRFVYAEKDKVDMLTGANWNIIQRSGEETYGDHYTITDTRFVDDGVTYAKVIDNLFPDMNGLVGYMEIDEGDFYIMEVEYGPDTVILYAFVGTNTDLYGRYWILPTGVEPTGDGLHARAAVDTFQAVHSTASASVVLGAMTGDDVQLNSLQGSKSNAIMASALRDLKKLEYDNSTEELGPMFSEAMIKSAFEKMTRARQLINEPLQ